MQNLSNLLPHIIKLSKKAGDEILKIYDIDYKIDEKDDKSPLTEADLASHHCIIAGLKKLTPEIPILSEESIEVPYNTRKQWGSYWLIDPLDGTKEFINKNGEFTVNIALIEDYRPILGVVYVPVKDITYAASQNKGAWKSIAGETEQRIQTRRYDGKKAIVVGSRSHRGSSLDAFLEQLPEYDILSMGSSLKLCLVAEGVADIYPRLGLTSEWDTAAAQCVVEQAGGVVYNVETWKPLAYNTKEAILNPFFFVAGDTKMDWQQYF